jgi:hypothetical protein
MNERSSPSWFTDTSRGMSMMRDAEGSPMRQDSVFERGESALAHAVYGLILTIATLGELVEHDVSAGHAVAWLLGSGAVLLAAHLFSDVLAHVAASRDDPVWNEILRVGHHDAAVTYGAIAAALAITAAGVADLDTERALTVCVIAGLIALGALTAYATAHHRRPIQIAMTVTAVVLGTVIVALENTV